MQTTWIWALLLHQSLLMTMNSQKSLLSPVLYQGWERLLFLFLFSRSFLFFNLLLIIILCALKLMHPQNRLLTLHQPKPFTHMPNMKKSKSLGQSGCDCRCPRPSDTFSTNELSSFVMWHSPWTQLNSLFPWKHIYSLKRCVIWFVCFCFIFVYVCFFFSFYAVFLVIFSKCNLRYLDFQVATIQISKKSCAIQIFKTEMKKKCNEKFKWKNLQVYTYIQVNIYHICIYDIY